MKQKRKQNTSRKSKIMPVYRTSMEIQNALRSNSKRNNKNSQMHDYICCRLNPFQGTGKGAIPDGGNNGFVVSDIMMYDNFTVPANQTVVIQTIPTMPCSALIQSQSGQLTVNGTVMNSGNNTFSVSNGACWFPLSILPPYANVSGSMLPGTYNNEPYNTKTQRLIAAGYRLVYTGEAQTCSGFITVTPNDVGFTPFQTSASPGAAGSTLTCYDNNSVITSSCPPGTQVLNMDWTIAPNAMTRDSVSFRPEQGVLFIPKHKSADFKNYNTPPTVWGICSNYDTSNTGVSGAANCITANNSAGIAPYAGGIIWYDQDWSSAQIAITGCQVNTPFRWETVWCFESQPGVGTLTSNLTRKLEPEQPMVLKMAANLTNKQPVAQPSTAALLIDPR